MEDIKAIGDYVEQWIGGASAIGRDMDNGLIEPDEQMDQLLLRIQLAQAEQLKRIADAHERIGRVFAQDSGEWMEHLGQLKRILDVLDRLETVGQGVALEMTRIAEGPSLTDVDAGPLPPSPGHGRWRKRPVVVDVEGPIEKAQEIETLEGIMLASVGDYIITGVKGERYPCKPEIFLATYEPVSA